jgi:hypothetical protein
MFMSFESCRVVGYLLFENLVGPVLSSGGRCFCPALETSFPGVRAVGNGWAPEQMVLQKVQTFKQLLKFELSCVVIPLKPLGDRCEQGAEVALVGQQVFVIM